MKPGLLVLLLYAGNVHASEAEQVFKAVHDSIVTITVFDERNEVDSLGSGVILASGRVITNCHVVQEATAIQVKVGEKEWKATVMLADTTRDLCQLDVPGLAAPAVKIRSYHTLQIGEPLYAVGNPLGFGLSVSSGLVSSIGLYKGQTRLFSSAPISPGSSGGGLFDSQGRLLGITSGFYPGAQNLNLALPADWINDLSKRGVTWRAPTASTPDPDWLGQSETLRVASKWIELAAWSRRWHEAYPTATLANTTLGLALLSMNQFTEAKDALLMALQQDPNNASAYCYLAQVQYALGEKDAAMLALQKAITLSPAFSLSYAVSAKWQINKGDIDAAIADVQTAIKLDPSTVYLWGMLGELQQKQKRFAEAAQAYRTVLRLKPNEPLATTKLALVLAAMGEASTARQLLTAAPPGLPSEADTWLRVGVAEDKQGHFAEAERAYRKAVGINPALAEAWYGLGILLQRTIRSAEAEEALRQTVKLRPDFAPAWVVLGQVFIQQGDKINAKEALEKATAADPKNSAAWYGLCLLLRDNGDIAGALAAGEQAILLDPANSLILAVVGELRLRNGHPDEAFIALQEAERLDPKNEIELQALSMYYGMRSDSAKSLDYALRALEINASSPQNWSNKGYALIKLQRYSEAIPALETATRLQPDFVTAWINLGEAYLHSKQLGKAISTLEQALKLAPQAANARLYVAQAYLGSAQPAKAKENLIILLHQQPNFAPAWALATVVSLSQSNGPEALAAYNRLKMINPAMAHNLNQAYRTQNPMSTITLPD